MQYFYEKNRVVLRGLLIYLNRSSNWWLTILFSNPLKKNRFCFVFSGLCKFLWNSLMSWPISSYFSICQTIYIHITNMHFILIMYVSVCITFWMHQTHFLKTKVNLKKKFRLMQENHFFTDVNKTPTASTAAELQWWWL